MGDSDENDEQKEVVDVQTMSVLLNVIEKIKETLSEADQSESQIPIPSVYDQELKRPLGMDKVGSIQLLH